MEHIESLDWIKNKHTTINPKNKDDKCFQQVVTVSLNYEIESHSDRVLNIKSFMNKCNWYRIRYPQQIDDLKAFGKNKPAIA